MLSAKGIDNLVQYCGPATIARIIFDIECSEHIPWTERSGDYRQLFQATDTYSPEGYTTFVSELDRLRRE